MPDDNGCAVPSSNSMGYQVINRIDENRVLIIIEPNGDMVQRVKTKINQLQETVAELQDKIDGNIGIPEYWKSPLKNGAQAINEKLCEAGSNKSAFLFYSDAHWTKGSKMSPTLLKYLHQNTGMTKTFYGGDIVEAENDDMMSYLWEWRSQLKDLPNHHSVVGNHDDGQTTNNLLSEQCVYGYLLASEETPDVVREDSGLYYYIDNSSEKTRYIFLDTAYKGVSTAQQDFIKQALLDTPNGWHIVAVAHIWYEYDYGNNQVGNLNSGATIILDMFDSYNAREGEYADCGGWVEFCVGGHTHTDYDDTSTNGIPIILVETDSKRVRVGSSYTEGTTDEASVNGIIADYDKHKIYVVCIGRGKSREIPINYPITNVLHLALDTDGTSVYNGKGWKENTRWSRTSHSETNENGIHLTGYIPFAYGDIVRLKDITMPTGTGNDSVVLFFPETTGAYERFSNGSVLDTDNDAVRDGEGNLIQFTANAKGSKYIRIQCGGINDESVITINEPIEKLS